MRRGRLFCSGRFQFCDGGTSPGRGGTSQAPTTTRRRHSECFWTALKTAWQPCKWEASIDNAREAAWIGARKFVAGPSLNGRLYEVRIYNRVLTPTDLATLSGQPVTFTVTRTADSGAGSLRQAILDANARAGIADIIAFSIAGAGVHTIAPTSPLPTITDPLKDRRDDAEWLCRNSAD